MNVGREMVQKTTVLLFKCLVSWVTSMVTLVLKERG